MTKTSDINKLSAIAVSLLLIFAAWNKAAVMLIFSAIGLAFSLIIFRKHNNRGGVLAAILGFFLAIVIVTIKVLA